MSLAPMEVTEKRISPVVMELSIEVPQALVKAEVDKWARTVQLSGAKVD